jgi:hypothetical protein
MIPFGTSYLTVALCRKDDGHDADGGASSLWEVCLHSLWSA